MSPQVKYAQTIQSDRQTNRWETLNARPGNEKNVAQNWQIKGPVCSKQQLGHISSYMQTKAK